MPSCVDKIKAIRAERQRLHSLVVSTSTFEEQMEIQNKFISAALSVGIDCTYKSDQFDWFADESYASLTFSENGFHGVSINIVIDFKNKVFGIPQGEPCDPNELIGRGRPLLKTFENDFIEFISFFLKTDTKNK